jgi:predicted acylesterase/phospholipase RssA
MSDALVLAGGVAKGAFGAGACAVLFNELPCLDVRRVVATSAGALNAAFLTPAIRSGVAGEAAYDLETLWLDHARFGDVFRPSLLGLAKLDGFSTSRKLRLLLARFLRHSTPIRPVELRLVVAAIAGRTVLEDGRAASTFERVLRFDGERFDRGSDLGAILDAVTASAAFPGAFRPVPIDVDGDEEDCLDGGLVNNAPIKQAIEDNDVDRVFVVTPSPSLFQPEPADGHGVGLLAHLVEILVSERLYRDLREARSVNRALLALEARLGQGPALEDALAALGWSGRRQLELVEIRPEMPLEGGAFDGFFDGDLRRRYIKAGEDAARAALGTLGRAAA